MVNNRISSFYYVVYWEACIVIIGDMSCVYNIHPIVQRYNRKTILLCLCVQYQRAVSRLNPVAKCGSGLWTRVVGGILKWPLRKWYIWNQDLKRIPNIPVSIKIFHFFKMTLIFRLLFEDEKSHIYIMFLAGKSRYVDSKWTQKREQEFNK